MTKLLYSIHFTYTYIHLRNRPFYSECEQRECGIPGEDRMEVRNFLLTLERNG